MKRLLKTTANFALVALMSAVVLRPMVVQTTSNTPLGASANPQISAFVHHYGHGPASAFLVSKTRKVSSLKVIPKEVFDFGILAPRFADSNLSLSSRLPSTAVSPRGGFSIPKPLVLRI